MYRSLALLVLSCTCFVLFLLEFPFSESLCFPLSAVGVTFNSGTSIFVAPPVGS